MRTRGQDWVNLVAGVWLFLTPWFFGYSHTNYAWNAFVFGAVIAILSVWALADRRIWEEWVNIVIGIWVFISPWVFGMVKGAAMWNHWIVGLVLVVFAIWSLSMTTKPQAA